MARTTAEPKVGLHTDVSPAPRRRSELRRRNTLIGWSFILPNFLGFAVLTLIPVVTTFYMSLTSWDLFGQADWVGSANFQRLFNDSSFWTATRNTFYYTALHVPLTIVVSLGLALLLNNKFRGVAFFRTAAFFPYITSAVAIAVVWNLLLSPDYGVINELLRSIGIANPPGWFTDPNWAMPAVAVVTTWRDMGYYMILFLAGLQTVPRELHEAARVDGANVWERFLNVTLPSLRPTMFFVGVILTINSFKIFDLILVMTNGGPGQATFVLSQFIYQKGFQENQFGYASAGAVALFVICLFFTLVQYAWNKRRAA